MQDFSAINLVCFDTNLLTKLVTQIPPTSSIHSHIRLWRYRAILRVISGVRTWEIAWAAGLWKIWRARINKIFNNTSKSIQRVSLRYYAYPGLIRNTGQYYCFENFNGRSEPFNMILIWISTCKLNFIFLEFFYYFLR